MDTTRNPTFLLDAGAETWERIQHLVGLRMDEMPAGAVLELVSQYSEMPGPLGNWCGETGHHLETSALDGRRTAFRITKRQDSVLSHLDDVDSGGGQSK